MLRSLVCERGNFYIKYICQKEGESMESYDNDGLILLLDDDLFPCSEETEESEK